MATILIVLSVPSVLPKNETVKAMPISRVKRCNSEDSIFVFRFCINKTPFLRDKIDLMLDLL